MSKPRLVALFGEDIGHELFVTAIVLRIAREEHVSVRVQTVTAAGGAGRALDELRLFQRARQTGAPDLLVVAIDANCHGWDKKRRQIEGEVDSARFPCWQVACPDPHIERWYLADPVSLAETLDAKVSKETRKCERSRYKQILADSLREAGQVLTLGGVEFAEEIVEAMDLYRAGQGDPSLKRFVLGVRSTFKQWRAIDSGRER